MLEKLIAKDDVLIAYQIAFDLVDKEQQTFTSSVLSHLATRSSEITEKGRLAQLQSILNGEVISRLNLQFLKKNNNTDMILINNTKDAIAARGGGPSMLHSATIWQNGIMNAYTTNDAFLRDNLKWAS